MLNGPKLNGGFLSAVATHRALWELIPHIHPPTLPRDHRMPHSSIPRSVLALNSVKELGTACFELDNKWSTPHIKDGNVTTVWYISEWYGARSSSVLKSLHTYYVIQWSNVIAELLIQQTFYVKKRIGDYRARAGKQTLKGQSYALFLVLLRR